MMPAMIESLSLSALALANLITVSTLIALMVLVAATRRTYPGFRHWVLALCLLVLAPATLLLVPEASPSGWSLILSWAPVLAASVVGHEGARRFRGRPSSWMLDGTVGGVALAGAAAVELLGGSYELFLVLVCTTTAAILLRAASTCFRGVRPGLRPAYHLLGGAFAWLALIALLLLLKGYAKLAGQMIQHIETYIMPGIVVVGSHITQTTYKVFHWICFYLFWL